jgi:hypothetical protein
MLCLILVPFALAQGAAVLDMPPAGDLPVVFPVRAVNLTPTEVAAAEAVFRAAYERTRGEAIYPLEHTLAVAPAGADDSTLLAACQQVACGRWVTVSLVRLGEEIVVRVTSHDASGTVIDDFDARAADLDDLYPLFDRLARSLVAGLPFDRTITRHNVTARETRPENRVALEAVPGFKVGWWRPFDSGSSSAAMGAFAIRWERERSFLELDAGLVLPFVGASLDAFGGVFADLGWGAFMQEGDSALYVSAGVGPRIMSWAGDGPIGLGAYASLGGVTGRTSRARSTIQVRLGVDVNGASRAWPYVGVEVGIGF